MSDFIFEPKSLFTNKDKDEIIDVELFTAPEKASFKDESGRPRSSDDNEHVIAKKNLRKNGTVKYTIKIGNNNKFVNPFSIYDKEHDNLFLNKVCRSNDKFREVSVKVFEYYIEFLKTKNIAWLNNAERENE